MRPRTVSAVALTAAAAALAACGGGNDERPAAPAPAPRLTAAQAHPAAPLAAGTLQRVRDGATARERLAFADLDGLRAAHLPVGRDALLRRVLGARGAAAATRAASGTAVTLGAGGALAAHLDRARPERSAITPAAPSAAQSCLGTTLAQTILGPGTMGTDAALGVGLAVSGDAPAGLQLRICGAPHYTRHLHAMERALKARFAAVRTADGRTPVIGGQEIGERAIMAATIPADGISAARLLNLLSGAEGLRALAW